MDIKELIELGDDEDLIDLRIDIAEFELALVFADVVIDRDEGAKSC